MSNLSRRFGRPVCSGMLLVSALLLSQSQPAVASTGVPGPPSGPWRPSLYYSGLTDPFQMAFQANGDLLVADNGNPGAVPPIEGGLIQIAPDGTSSSIGPGLEWAVGVANDQQGDTYVTSCNFAGLTSGGTAGAFLAELTPGGTEKQIGSFNCPETITIGSDGSVYVIDQSKSGSTYVAGVDKVAPDGSQTTLLPATSSQYASSVAVDGSGDVFIGVQNLDGGGGGILEFAPDGAESTFATTTGATFPAALEFDAAGNLWVAESGPTLANNVATANIVEYNAQGEYSTVLTMDGPAGTSSSRTYYFLDDLKFDA